MNGMPMDRHHTLPSALFVVFLCCLLNLGLKRCEAAEGTEPRPSHAAIDAEFNALVFHEDGDPDAESLARFRMKFLLSSKLRSLDSACRLSQEQTRKITQAGNGDLARCVDRIHAARTRFHEFMRGPDDAKDQVLEKNLEELSELLTSPRQFLDTESLFEKSCQKVLSEEQKSHLQKLKLSHSRLEQHGGRRSCIDIHCVFLKADPLISPDRKLDLKDVFGDWQPYIARFRSTTNSRIPRPAALSAHLTAIRDSAEFFNALGQQGIAEVLARPEMRTQDGVSQSACLLGRKSASGDHARLMVGCEITSQILPQRRIRMKICLGASRNDTPATWNSGTPSGIHLEQCELIAGSNQLVIVRGFRLPRETDNERSLPRRGAAAPEVAGVTDHVSPELIAILFPVIIETAPQ